MGNIDQEIAASTKGNYSFGAPATMAGTGSAAITKFGPL